MKKQIDPAVAIHCLVLDVDGVSILPSLKQTVAPVLQVASLGSGLRLLLVQPVLRQLVIVDQNEF